MRSIDRITIGNGDRGPIATALQRAFFDIINGAVPDSRGWLTQVYQRRTLVLSSLIVVSSTGL